jgi:putative NIF3 family GTP cyclohydrolase 1 type 2
VNVGVQVGDLQRYLDGLLAVGEDEDYGPNGLQIEGRTMVHKIISGVTAGRAPIDIDNPA